MVKILLVKANYVVHSKKRLSRAATVIWCLTITL